MYANLIFYLLKTTIHFVYVSSFYFDQELLQYCLQYESYSYNIDAIVCNIIKLYFIVSFFIIFFISACSPLGGQTRGKPRYPT
jgi:hypothetical protein